jgi:hypothetical protein
MDGAAIRKELHEQWKRNTRVIASLPDEPSFSGVVTGYGGGGLTGCLKVVSDSRQEGDRAYRWVRPEQLVRE